MMELWAAYCAREGLDFGAFSRGVDIMLADAELWSQRGFNSLRDAVWQSL